MTPKKEIIYIYTVKGALDKFNIIPQFFPKKFGFLYHYPPIFFKKSLDLYTIRSVGMGNDCMLSFIF